jgi:GTPase SAR1 family protein/Ca2+-binding EF-hand superfamily protein
VIVAENKLDLFRPINTSSVGTSATTTPQQQQQQADEHAAIARMKRQQIVALMQRFPFVRQCIKCSAKSLLRVDDVFLKAQQAVLYPFVPPLYDLETGQLTIECKRALTRIFRMFDKDYDGLLSDAEWDRFQRETFHFAIVDHDLAAWKKVLTRNNPSETEEQVLQDDKFTIQGFLTMFDVFISQNRLDVVWQALRKFNYDDDLNLHIPDSIMNPEDNVGVTTSSWKLSSAAKLFLTNIFRQFDSDKDGYLSPDDIITIFSVLPPPALPPWHPMRAPELFEGCFSIPKESPSNGSSSSTDSPGEFGGDTSLIVPSTAMASLQQDHSMLSTSGVSILSASDSLPTLDVGGMYPLSKSLSYLEWMGHWHTISATSPSITRIELYRLGYIENNNRKNASDRRRSSRRLNYHKIKQKMSVPIPIQNEKANPYQETVVPSREILVTVLGKRNCGKTALLNALCGSYESSLDSSSRAVDTSITYRPETSTTYVKLKRTYVTNSNSSTNDREGEELVVHLVFMDVPESAAVRQGEHIRQLNELFGPANATSNDRFCDLAMLVFDSTDASSLALALDMEAKLLRKDTPRLFVATKHDLVVGCDSNDDETVQDKASFHCREADLELPYSTSALEGLGADREKILDHIARCALKNESGIEHLKSRPHEAEKRREAARRRNMLWLGGIVSVGVAVAVGVGLLLASGVSAAKKDQKSSFSWLRSLFGGGLRIPKDTPQSA